MSSANGITTHEAHFVVYSLDGCPYCERTKQLMDKLPYPARFVRVTQENKGKYKEMNGMQTFPQIFVTLTWEDAAASRSMKSQRFRVGGYDQFVKTLQAM